MKTATTACAWGPTRWRRSRARSPGLPERERFGVVSNAIAAVRSGDLPASALLALLAKLPKEQSRLVWSEVIDALWSIDRALVSDAARPAFARFVRDAGRTDGAPPRLA